MTAKDIQIKKNIFENVLRICVLDTLYDYLKSNRCYYYSNNNNICDDLFKLAHCNKYLNFLVTCNLLKYTAYPLSLILKWDNNKLKIYEKHIHIIYADILLKNNITF